MAKKQKFQESAFEDPKVCEPTQAIDITKEETVKTVESKYPTVAEVNEEIDSEYGWVGTNLVNVAKAILRELVIARLERRKHGG